MTNIEKARNAKVRAEAIEEAIMTLEQKIECYQDTIKFIEEEWRENEITSEEDKKKTWRYDEYEHAKRIVSAFVEIENSILK